MTNQGHSSPEEQRRFDTDQALLSDEPTAAKPLNSGILHIEPVMHESNLHESNTPEQTSAATPAPTFPVLDATEARIVGCLIEKAAITPEVYPLTVNAVVAACNQKTSRDPVMALETGEVANVLRRLESRGLVRLAPASQRASRYEHRFDAVYNVTARQRAVLCVMLLRGPQTLGELFTRSERIAEFPSLDDVRDTVERLAQREPALIVRLPRGAGQREDRYMHLLGGPVDLAAWERAAPAPAAAGGLTERVERLEADLRDLRETVALLRARLDGPGDP